MADVRMSSHQPSLADRPDDAEESTLEFSPLATSSLVEEVANRLYAAVVEGKIRPGQRLSEAAIARSLGVSRGPIREGQRLLERRGLLIFQPRKGFFVRKLSVREVEDLFDLRERLECYSASLAVARAADDELAELQAWLRRLRSLPTSSAESASDSSRLVEEDLGLHRMICRLSAHATLITIYEQILNELRLALSMINMRFGDPETIADSHAALVDALVGRDAAAAVIEVANHLAFSRQSLLRRLAEQDRDAELQPQGAAET